MSALPPGPPYAKRRLPFPDQISLVQSGAKRLVLFLLAIAAMLCCGAVYYALSVRGLAISSAEVLAPGFGAGYFLLRLFFALRPRPNSR